MTIEQIMSILSTFDNFIKSIYGLEMMCKIKNCTFTEAIDAIHEVYDSMIEYGLTYEVASHMVDGNTFFDSCADWDLI